MIGELYLCVLLGFVLLFSLCAAGKRSSNPSPPRGVRPAPPSGPPDPYNKWKQK